MSCLSHTLQQEGSLSPWTGGSLTRSSVPPPNLPPHIGSSPSLPSWAWGEKAVGTHVRRNPFVTSAASLGAPQRQHLMSLHISCGSCRQQAFNICRITHTAAILSLLPLLQEKDRQPSPTPGTITILSHTLLFFFGPGHTALGILVPWPRTEARPQ